MVLVPLKCTCMPSLLQVFLNFSPKPCMYWTTIEMFLCFLLLMVTLVLKLLVCWVSVGLGPHCFCVCVQSCAAVCLRPNWGRDKIVMLFLCGAVLWISLFDYWKLLYPCVLKCCIHYVWRLCSSCYPNEGIGQFMLVFCILWC